MPWSQEMLKRNLWSRETFCSINLKKRFDNFYVYDILDCFNVIIIEVTIYVWFNTLSKNTCFENFVLNV